jgi:hypothetical protein
MPATTSTAIRSAATTKTTNATRKTTPPVSKTARPVTKATPKHVNRPTDPTYPFQMNIQINFAYFTLTTPLPDNGGISLPMSDFRSCRSSVSCSMGWAWMRPFGFAGGSLPRSIPPVVSPCGKELGPMAP